MAEVVGAVVEESPETKRIYSLEVAHHVRSRSARKALPLLIMIILL